jgi:hypothetical protein
MLMHINKFNLFLSVMLWVRGGGVPSLNVFGILAGLSHEKFQNTPLIFCSIYIYIINWEKHYLFDYIIFNINFILNFIITYFLGNQKWKSIYVQWKTVLTLKNVIFENPFLLHDESIRGNTIPISSAYVE